MVRRGKPGNRKKIGIEEQKMGITIEKKKRRKHAIQKPKCGY